jgi:hypothetical protein
MQLSLERAEQGAEFEGLFSAELQRYPRLRFIPERGASIANTLALLCEISRGCALICAFFEHKQAHLLHHANVAADRRAIEFKEVAELRQSNLTLLFQDLQEGELSDVNSGRSERLIIERRDPARSTAGHCAIAGKCHDYVYTPVMGDAQICRSQRAGIVPVFDTSKVERPTQTVLDAGAVSTVAVLLRAAIIPTAMCTRCCRHNEWTLRVRAFAAIARPKNGTQMLNGSGAVFVLPTAERHGAPARTADRAAMRSARRQSAAVQCIPTQTTMRAYSDCS